VTSVPDSIDARTREALIANYEDLRRRAFGRAGGAGRGVGFALFVRSGMAGWMATCAALPLPTEAPVARRSATEQPLMPQDFRVEVATLLAEMALSAHAQGSVTT